ncbi:MAG: class I SAM-dependent methyltransferase [Verrucomicrobiae bacterium]|nr:class I SAM-dependent methyltransferase [Verrucomicrobiae bacterium]
MNIIDKFSTILSSPAGYRLFSRLVGGNVWQTHLADHVQPVAGEKILDIGCGPADVLNYLPACDYSGIDISPEYIASAQKRFAGRGRFHCQGIGLATMEQAPGSFDLALATGVLHHLDDKTADELFKLARLALRPGGRLITYDGCYVPNQSKIARWLLDHDRGKHVRTQAEYVRLASTRFHKVESHLRHDLLRVPYTHLIMRCG